jgi:hypothetical protein
MFRYFYSFDILALLVLFSLLFFLNLDASWIFLIVPVWIGVRIWLFRRNLMDQGIWTTNEYPDQPPASPPALNWKRNADRAADENTIFPEEDEIAFGNYPTLGKPENSASEECDVETGPTLAKKIRRAAALLLAVSFVIYSVAIGPSLLWVLTLLFVIAPLVAIWWGDPFHSPIGEVIGYERYEFWVEIFGWFLLFLTPLIIYLEKMRLDFLQNMRNP